MPTNSTTLTERFNEMAALAAVNASLNALGELVKEPNGKRYNRTSAARRERWLQISSLAEQQAQRTSEPTVRRAARRARPTSGGNDNGNDTNTNVPIKAAPIAMPAP